MSGFTSAKGCFLIGLFKSKTVTGFAIRLVFQLNQHSRDKKLIRSLIEYFNCRGVYKDSDAYYFRVTKFIDIEKKIIPFFQKHPILGVKAKDFNDFCEVAGLIKEKKDLTHEGLEQIRRIKYGINRGRKFKGLDPYNKQAEKGDSENTLISDCTRGSCFSLTPIYVYKRDQSIL